MTTPVFPSRTVLPGLTFPVKMEPEFRTSIFRSRSGLESRVAFWSEPLFHWEMIYEFLRSGSQLEMQTLLAMFGQLFGQFGPFLYADDDQNAVVDQAIATGDGTTKTFNLVRNITANGFTMQARVKSPNLALTHTAKVAGVTTSATWTDYDAAAGSQGQITFASAPAAMAAITASFSYYFPCRFETDNLTLQKFMNQLYSGESVPFVSIK